MAGGGKGGGAPQIVGHRYLMAMLMGLCRGPIDALVEIRIGDISAWIGNVTGNTSFSIDKSTLFGGDSKEGGVRGPLTVLMGEATQDLTGSNVQSTILGSTVETTLADGFITTFTVDGAATLVAPVVGATINVMSSLRGVVTLFFNGLVCSNNPYPKSWKMRVQRALKGWHNDTPWYPEKALIALTDEKGASIHAMNGAHIVYECLTNPVWGRGLPTSALDDASFRVAADTLYSENFGLCMQWTRSSPLSDFMQLVFNHIGGALYPDKTTGLMKIKLLRKDYLLFDLPVYDYKSGVIEITDDQTTAPDNSHSEIIVNWVDPVIGNARQTRVQNLAGTQANQTVTSTKADYIGLPTAELAARIAVRDLGMQAAGIKRFTIKFDRRGREIQPAGVFRLHIPERNIINMVLRAGKVEEGAITDQTVTVTVIQDVFSMESATYLAKPERAWRPPDRSLNPITLRAVQELNYRDLVRTLSTADLNNVEVASGGVVTAAVAPTALSTSYEVWTEGTGEAYAFHGTFGWVPSAVLFADLGYYDTSMVVASGTQLDTLTFPTAAWIGSEIVEVTSYDSGTNTMVIGRGSIDTIPVPHTAGARVWFPDDTHGGDGREYATSEVVDTKLLTKTNIGILDISLASVDTVTIVGRQSKPYPPGNFKIGGNPFASVTTQIGDVVFSWAHRDRITQADHMLAHPDASTGPETSTTYQADIYRGATLLRSTTGITADNWTYDLTMAGADGSPNHVTVKLRSERSGLLSFQEYSWSFYRINVGYGRGYGQRYG